MKLSLFPSFGLAGQVETAFSVSGDVLVINGSPYDLSAVPEGGSAEANEPERFVGPITRSGGEIYCGVLVVLGEDAAPSQPVDPMHWCLSVADGPVTLPVARVVEEVTQ